MDRVFSKVLLSVFFLFIIIALTVPAQAGPIKWRVITTWTPAISLIKSDEHFIKTVNELCKGELEMKLFPAGTIVGSFEVFDAVQSGSVQAGFDWPGYWAGKNTAFGALGGLPAGPNQTDLIAWIYDGGGAEIAAEVYGQYGMNYIFTIVSSAESGLRGKKAFLTRDDFKGSKVRMSGMFQGKILQELGAAQVMLAGQESYQALEKGVIDAAEFSSPDNDWNLGFHEVTSVWNVPGWHQPASCAGIMINKKAWDKLPKHLQDKINIAAQANVTWALAHFGFSSGEYAKKWMDKGVKVETLDDKTIAEIQDMAYRQFVEEARKNPTFAKVVYSLYDTVKILGYYRDKELPLMKRDIKLPDMDALKKAAGK